jgi:hypothetical protein
MKSKEILCRLLYYALLEIRNDALESRDKKTFAIAHYLHTIPLQIINAESEEDFEKILAEFEGNFKKNEGLNGLLKQFKKEMKKNFK